MRPLIAAVIGARPLVGGAPPAIAGAADQADLSAEVGNPGWRIDLYVTRDRSSRRGANAPQYLVSTPRSSSTRPA